MHYIRHLKFGNYQLFQEVLKSYLHLFDVSVKLAEDMTPEILKKYEGAPELHKIMTHIYADKIHSGYMAPVTIEWIDDILGYGAFAERDFKKDEYIGEYVGEVRPFPIWSKQNEHSIIYPNQTMMYYRVDAKVEGNELHFYNHSYNPNIYSILAFDRGLIHSSFLAIEDIPKGTQLTWNYGKEFWIKCEPPKDI